MCNHPAFLALLYTGFPVALTNYLHIGSQDKTQLNNEHKVPKNNHIIGDPAFISPGIPVCPIIMTDPVTMNKNS